MAALQHGLPVISTNPETTLPQILPNENMLLAPAQNISDLTKQAINIIENGDLRHRLGLGAKKLGDQFDWPIIAEKTSALYRALVS